MCFYGRTSIAHCRTLYSIVYALSHYIDDVDIRTPTGCISTHACVY